MLRQLLLAVVVAAFVVACLRLGWWQLQRYNAGGSWQNLGYTLQWPTFALFVIFMVWRLRKLERERGQGERPEQRPGQRPEQRPPGLAPSAAARPRPVTSQRQEADEPDDELAAYNRYLAELNAAELNAAEPSAKERRRGR